MSGLNKKQRLFCLEYLVDLNATQAAIRAGYSEKTAQAQSSRLLSNVMVQAEIQRLMDERTTKAGVRADQTLINVARFANYDIRDIVEIDTETLKNAYQKDDFLGMFVPIEDAKKTIIRIKPLDDTNAHLIQKVKVGKYGLEVELPDRIKANELLGKHLKLFTDKQEVEHKGQVEVIFNIRRPGQAPLEVEEGPDEDDSADSHSVQP